MACLASKEPDNMAEEWVAHVGDEVLITFVSLPQGGNLIKEVQFRLMLNTINGLYYLSIHSINAQVVYSVG